MAAHRKLKSHTEYQNIHDKLVAGIAVEKIAADLQNEGHFTEITQGAVIQMLYRYKRDLPVTTLAHYPGHVQTKIKRAKEQLDEIDELQKLAKLQIGRIDQLLDQEKKVKFPFKDLNPIIALAKDLLINSAELKMKLGIYDEAAKNVNLNVKDDRIESLPEETRKNMGNAARAILEAIQKDMDNEIEVIEADYTIEEDDE